MVKKKRNSDPKKNEAAPRVATGGNASERNSRQVAQKSAMDVHSVLLFLQIEYARAGGSRDAHKQKSNCPPSSGRIGSRLYPAHSAEAAASCIAKRLVVSKHGRMVARFASGPAMYTQASLP